MRRISWLLPVAASAAALAVTAPAGAHGTAACGDRFIPVVVGGKHRCLQWQMACRSRWNADYHRYLFDCHQGYLVYWWRGLLRRPLRIPTIAAGTPCPADSSNGPGPAYPTLSIENGRATLPYLVGWGYDGWDGTKLLWTVPHYRGPYIVRGRQLDGPGVLRFDQGPNWTNKLHPELRLVGPYADLNPAATFLQGPGCYAYQVDGRGFSYTIVFAAQPVG
jgi:hypothetical protein